MKQLTCKQIGGVCDHVLKAETPGEMAKVATAHITEKAKTDPVHKKSYEEMEAIYNDKDRHAKWMTDFKASWEAAPTL